MSTEPRILPVLHDRWQFGMRLIGRHIPVMAIGQDPEDAERRLAEAGGMLEGATHVFLESIEVELGTLAFVARGTAAELRPR